MDVTIKLTYPMMENYALKIQKMLEKCQSQEILTIYQYMVKTFGETWGFRLKVDICISLYDLLISDVC